MALFLIAVSFVCFGRRSVLRPCSEDGQTGDFLLAAHIPSPGGSGFELDRDLTLACRSNGMAGTAEKTDMAVLAPASANLWLPEWGIVE